MKRAGCVWAKSSWVCGPASTMRILKSGLAVKSLPAVTQAVVPPISWHFSYGLDVENVADCQPTSCKNKIVFTARHYVNVKVSIWGAYLHHAFIIQRRPWTERWNDHASVQATFWTARKPEKAFVSKGYRWDGRIPGRLTQRPEP